MTSKNIVLQSLVVILIFLNILGMDYAAEDMWETNRTHILSLFFNIVLLVVLLLKEAPKEVEKKSNKHFKKRK